MSKPSLHPSHIVTMAEELLALRQLRSEVGEYLVQLSPYKTRSAHCERLQTVYEKSLREHGFLAVAPWVGVPAEGTGRSWLAQGQCTPQARAETLSLAAARHAQLSGAPLSLRINLSSFACCMTTWQSVALPSLQPRSARFEQAMPQLAVGGVGALSPTVGLLASDASGPGGTGGGPGGQPRRSKSPREGRVWKVISKSFLGDVHGPYFPRGCEPCWADDASTVVAPAR